MPDLLPLVTLPPSSLACLNVIHHGEENSVVPSVRTVIAAISFPGNEIPRNTRRGCPRFLPRDRADLNPSNYAVSDLLIDVISVCHRQATALGRLDGS